MQKPIVFRAGRFGNRLFGNMALHFLCKQYNFPVEYTCLSECNHLGLQFYTPSPTDPTNARVITMSDNNFVKLFDGAVEPNTSYRIRLDGELYYQSRDFDMYLQRHFVQVNNQAPIIAANPYKSRYNTNRDVFVHMRLGDIAHCAPSDEYFDTALANISEYEKGWISSDSPNHPRVRAFAAKHNFEIIALDEVATIQFASTCRHLILSQGTFSWWIGILAFYSSVQWPAIKKPWHGDIFVFPEWKEIQW